MISGWVIGVVGVAVGRFTLICMGRAIAHSGAYEPSGHLVLERTVGTAEEAAFARLWGILATGVVVVGLLIIAGVGAFSLGCASATGTVVTAGVSRAWGEAKGEGATPAPLVASRTGRIATKPNSNAAAQATPPHAAAIPRMISGRRSGWRRAAKGSDPT